MLVRLARREEAKEKKKRATARYFRARREAQREAAAFLRTANIPATTFQSTGQSEEFGVIRSASGHVLAPHVANPPFAPSVSHRRSRFGPGFALSRPAGPEWIVEELEGEEQEEGALLGLEPLGFDDPF